jgi:uncharacterized protein
MIITTSRCTLTSESSATTAFFLRRGGRDRKTTAARVRYLPTMDIRKQLDEDLKEAMRAKDTVRLETVRNVKGTVRSREIDSGAELDAAEITRVIRGLVKQREESIAQYREGGRADLVDRETQEKAILEAYLPAGPSAGEIDAAVAAAVGELGASSIKDMGRVMKAVMERLGPAADGKLVSAAVKAKLS